MNKEEILSQYGLAENSALTPVGYTTEEEWHKLRQKGIGGSDVGAILKINKYTSPLMIYKAKVKGIVKDLSDNVAVKKGKELEEYIREHFVKPKFKAIGYTVKHLDHLLINSKYEWLRANLDGIAIKDEGHTYKNNVVIEIKVVTEHAESNWYGEDYCGVPASYYAQVQEYMLVTGATKAVVCALFEKSWEMHYFEVPQNIEFMKVLITESKNFYENNMLLGIEPPLILPLDAPDAIEKLHKSIDIKTYIDEDLTNIAKEYKEVAKQIKELEKRKDALNTEITTKYIAGARPDTTAIKVNIATRTTRRLNTEKLQAAHPEIDLEQYKDVSEYQVTTVK